MISAPFWSTCTTQEALFCHDMRRLTRMAKACAEDLKYRLGLPTFSTFVRCIVHICCTVYIVIRAVKLRRSLRQKQKNNGSIRDTFNCIQIHSNLFSQAGNKKEFGVHMLILRFMSLPGYVQQYCPCVRQVCTQ